MKHGWIKKWTALLLALLMVTALLVPAAAAKDTKGTPVIFIPDMMNIIYYRNPNTLNETQVFNWNEQSQGYITDILAGLLQANENAEVGAARISAVIEDIFQSIRFNDQGKPAVTGIGPATYSNPVAYNTEEPIYTDNIAAFVTAAKQYVSADRIFVFNYDWRVESRDNAKALSEYIARVKANTGCKKVSLVSGGYGGVVANAYLYYYANEAKNTLTSCVFLDTCAAGSSIIGDVMSGDLIRTVADVIEGYDGSIFDLGSDIYDTIQGTDVGDALSRYLTNDPTGMFTAAISSRIGDSQYSKLFALLFLALAGNIIEDQGMFTKLGSGYRDVLIAADDYIYNAGLREYMRNMPGLWAAVPSDSYQQALYFMFGNDLQVGDELKAKIERCNEVVEATEKTIQTAKQNGINVTVVAGYDLQILPITSSLVEQSDGLQATRYAGLGATTGDMKHNLKLSKQCSSGNHNHMEPGKKVDASTCYLPENTWFIKGHEHMDYKSDTISAFLVWLVTNDSQRTVWQSNLYPQYLQVGKIKEEISAYSDPMTDQDIERMYGDLDSNGSVDAADARMALRYAVGLEKSPSRMMLMIGDVNHTGEIDAGDARLILRYAVGLEKTLG